MRKILVVVVLLGAAAGGAWYYWSGPNDAAEAAAVGTGAPGAGGTAGRGRGRGGVAMAVDSSTVARHDLVEFITVVGNLIGQTTVDVTPRIAGRLDSVSVKLGDRVEKGQQLAKVEDREIREQVNQSEANLDVNTATVTARENDARLAQTTLDRIRATYNNGLVSKQNLEDAESRWNSAVSSVAVAKAQAQSTQARLQELRVNLSNTLLLSPVDGFVGKRNLDPGAFAGNNTPVLSIVDIGTVRLIANLVEKDFRRVGTGAHALVEVDAFPGEQFSGKVSRVAPVFDPATRTATMEIEVPNPGYRLKPGMYARVRLTAEERKATLTVPRDAVVDLEGKHGVYIVDGDNARFHAVATGISDGQNVEVLSGLDEGTRVVTTGALAVRDGDRISLAGRGGAAGRGGRAAGEAGGKSPATPPGTPGSAPAGADAKGAGSRGESK